MFCQRELSWPEHVRPLAPERDLAQVAALMEEAFAGRLEAGALQALNDLRLMSHLGPLLWLLTRISPEFQASFFGFVWEEGHQILGNVSLQQTAHPERWLISNVAVRREYQGRGIARALLTAALEYIRSHGGTWALLQVRADNEAARRLYEHLGFTQISATTELRLDLSTPLKEPLPLIPGLRPLRPEDWEAEWELARNSLSPGDQWLKPLRPEQFQRPWDKRVSEWIQGLFAGQRMVRWGVEEKTRLVATLKVSASFAWRGEHHLALQVHPDRRGELESPLVETALVWLGAAPCRPVRARVPGSHPEAMTALKERGFQELKTMIEMRLNVAQRQLSKSRD